MKTIVLGDTHGRSTWKKIAEDNKDFDRFIFIGDYFDSKEDISTDDQISNFLDIIKFKKSQEREDKEVVMLIGNHDEVYFPEIGYMGQSGYQSSRRFDIEKVISENREHLNICYYFDNILFTHAGVSEEFMSDNFDDFDASKWDIKHIYKALTKLWDTSIFRFNFNGIDRSGDDIWQTPIWIRPVSLMKASKKFNKQGIIQVVGHTQMKKIDLDRCKSFGYFFIDTIAVGEYLIINDNEFSVGKVKI